MQQFFTLHALPAWEPAKGLKAGGETLFSRVAIKEEIQILNGLAAVGKPISIDVLWDNPYELEKIGEGGEVGRVIITFSSGKEMVETIPLFTEGKKEGEKSKKAKKKKK